MSDNPGGRSLGTATARIRIQIDGLAAARGQLQTAANGMKQALDGAAKSADALGTQGAAGVKRVGDTAKSAQRDVMSLKDALGNIRSTLLGVSTVAAGMTLFGAKAAQDVKRTQVSIELLSGSAEKARKIAEDTRALSRQFGTPYLQLLEGAQAFLPLAKTTGVELNTLLKTAQKFQAYNPAKNFGEIKFSINEAISGDFVSIKDALDLSKKQREDLKKIFEEQGATGVITEINRILNERGFDDKTLEAFGKSGVNAFANLQDAVKEAGATAFGPFLNTVLVPAVQGFTDFVRTLNETSPALLQIGAGFVVAVTAGGPLILMLSQVATALKTIKALSTGTQLGEMLKGAGGVLKYAAVGATAVAAGGMIGQRVATGLADRGIGDQRLRSDSGENFWDVIGERVKQVIVIVTEQLMYFAETLAKIAVFVLNAVNQFLNVFRLGGAMLGVIFGHLQRTFSELMIGFANAASGLFDTTGIRNAGQAGVNDANIRINTAAQEGERVARELTRGFKPKDSDIAAVEASFRDLRQSVVGGVTDMLFPTAAVVEEAVATINKVVADANKITFEGDQIEAFIDMQEDLAEMEAQAAQEREAAVADHQQRMTDIQLRFEEQRAKALEQQARQEAKDRVALAKQEAKLRADAEAAAQKAAQEDQAARLEAQQKADESAQKLEVDHKQKLAAIDRQFRQDMIQSASKLDAIGVYNAFRNRQEQQQQENDAYEQRKSEIQTQLDEELAQIQQARVAQLEEQRVALEAQIAEARVAMEERHALQREDMAYQFAQADLERQQELQKEQEQHALRMAQLDQRAAEERQKREQAFVEEFNRLSTSENQKLAVQRMGQDQAIRLLEQYWKNHNDVMRRQQPVTPPPAYTPGNPAGNPQQAPAPRPPAGTPAPSTPGPVIGPTGVSYFDTGGRVMRRAAYSLQPDEQVLRPEIANQLRRFMGGEINQKALVDVFAGGGAPNVINHIDNINNHYGDMGGRSNREMSEITTEAIIDALLVALGRKR